MSDHNTDLEAQISQQVLNSFDNTPDARFKQIMHSLVRHLHGFVREVELTEREWLDGIRFLTDTGHMCDGQVRQEFILLSDTLGVSMLVDAINHRHSIDATQTTVFGPFYIEGMPERAYGENMAFTPGQRALVRGRVVDAHGNPWPVPCWTFGRRLKMACIRARIQSSLWATCEGVTAPMPMAILRSAR